MRAMIHGVTPTAIEDDYQASPPQRAVGSNALPWPLPLSADPCLLNRTDRRERGAGRQRDPPGAGRPRQPGGTNTVPALLYPALPTR